MKESERKNESGNGNNNNNEQKNIGQLMRMVQGINEKVEQLATNSHYSDISDYVLLMNSPRKLFSRSLISGIGRGVGIAVGFTVFMISLLYFLRALGALDLPIIGDYIADIVEIVQNQLQLRSY